MERAPRRALAGHSEEPLRLLLVNPRNPLVNLTNKANYWNRYRVWKPLGLLVLAGLSPPDWEITVVDENVARPDYSKLPRPHLVGLTAFTSQAPRAYELAADFRDRGIPVVMGGIHASARPAEAAGRVDAVVTGEAENVWSQVLADCARGELQSLYAGGHADMDETPSARHDLLPTGYSFGTIQTTRGCPLDCSFCSVSSFNGRAYRHRPVEKVVAELALIREKRVLIVDDNLIGTRGDHIARAKELFRAMIEADLGKNWVCQATINLADDEELLRLARRAGCTGAFIGFESTSDAGLVEVHKKYNLRKSREFRDSVRRIQSHGITVAGSFILGLDVDRPGVGRQIAATASRYGLDLLNVLFLTPLPGTRLWTKMEEDGRIVADQFPEDWRFYTLNLPVGRYQNLTQKEALGEMRSCIRTFYSARGILGRVMRNLGARRQPILTLVGNLSYRINGRQNRASDEFCRIHGPSRVPLPATGENHHVLRPPAAGDALRSYSRSEGS